MNDLNMNRLPVATWNQCGVNSAPQSSGAAGAFRKFLG